MMEFVLKVFEENRTKEAVIWRDTAFFYSWFLERMQHWQQVIEGKNIPRGAVVVLEADFSPDSIALFLALTNHACILVPLTPSVAAKRTEFIQIAQGEVSVLIDPEDRVSIQALPYRADHEFYGRLRAQDLPGLVLFSSGSTGKSKAAVHDLSGLLEKFKVRRQTWRTVTFLLYDHIGGVNTMLYTLANAGCIITIPDRSPDGVLAAVARHRAELLPTSPTFLNLVLLSEAWKRQSLDSLKTVTYGTEPMPESTLRRFRELFPGINLQQTYGLSEVGILRSKSKSSDSLWMKVGGEGFETRIVDGTLQIKGRSAMLGYLNAPSPFTPDGWFPTGDAVEVDGEWLRILGRRSEMINVGGEKVYPAEVENVLQTLGGVEEVTVAGAPNIITGQMVVARVKLRVPEPPALFRQRLRDHCRGQLPDYKIPQKVILVQESQGGVRFKKMRHAGTPENPEGE